MSKFKVTLLALLILTLTACGGGNGEEIEDALNSLNNSCDPRVVKVNGTDMLKIDSIDEIKILERAILDAFGIPTDYKKVTSDFPILFNVRPAEEGNDPFSIRDSFSIQQVDSEGKIIGPYDYDKEGCTYRVISIGSDTALTSLEQVTLHELVHLAFGTREEILMNMYKYFSEGSAEKLDILYGVFLPEKDMQSAVGLLFEKYSGLLAEPRDLINLLDDNVIFNDFENILGIITVNAEAKAWGIEQLAIIVDYQEYLRAVNGQYLGAFYTERYGVEGNIALMAIADESKATAVQESLGKLFK